MSYKRSSRRPIKQVLALSVAVLTLTTALVFPSSQRYGSRHDLAAVATSALHGPAPDSSSLTLPDEASRARVKKAFGALPLSFEANQGQTNAQVKFMARGSGYTLFLTATEAVLSVHRAQQLEAQGQTAAEKLTSITAGSEGRASAVVRMTLVGSNRQPQIEGNDLLSGKHNYFKGHNPQRWRTNVPLYRKVKYSQVYRGVDLVYYGKGQQLEYDFVVAAGADPRRIRLSFAGAEQARINERGDLILQVAGGELRQPRPVVYQEVSGVRKEIGSHYVLRAASNSALSSPDSYEVGIEVASYDASRELVIDPELDYSTYLGGSGDEDGKGIAVDSKGNAYVAGVTASSDFPTTEDAFRPTDPDTSNTDVFVTKLDRDGEELVYSTYLGGDSSETGRHIVVDGKGNAYVTGNTNSTDFPTTPDAFEPTDPDLGDADAFVTKLNRDGEELVYSTYLGGSDFDLANSIALDGKGNAYVTGLTTSSNFPTTPGAFQTGDPSGSQDAFVTKLDRDGEALVYSTYLGGSSTGFSSGNGIAMDSRGNAYVTGGTSSPDFPTTPDAFQTAFGGDQDAFVTKLNSKGEGLVYSTYLGSGCCSSGSGIAVDSKSNAHVAGFTSSSTFPTTPDSFQPTDPDLDNRDAFVTKLNSRGSALVYSTYLGGSESDGSFCCNIIAVDSKGNAYVFGSTESPLDFPTKDAFQPMYGGGIRDTFATKLSPSGKRLVYSSYHGGCCEDDGLGIAVDRNGNAYVVGETSSVDFPVENAFQPAKKGAQFSDDAFVSKIKEDD